MIAVCVLGILTGISQLIFSSFIEQRRLSAQARQLQLAVQQARSLALLEGRPVRMNFARYPDSDTWCYGLRLHQSCDCRVTEETDPAFCQVDRLPWRVDSEQLAPVRLASRRLPFDGELSINGERGTMTPGRVIMATEHYEVSLVASAFGRLRLCTDSAGRALPGAVPC